jgi:hypothetical protein
MWRTIANRRRTGKSRTPSRRSEKPFRPDRLYGPTWGDHVTETTHSDADEKQDATADSGDPAASSSEKAKEREREMEDSGEENAG